MNSNLVVNCWRSLKSRVTERQLKFLRGAFSPFVANNLTTLSRLHGSDKYGGHFYTPHYQQHFGPWRDKPVKFLEIGIGGYDNPKEGGASLRMWKSFFRRGSICGIDIYDKSAHDEARIKTFKGSQVDQPFLMEVMRSAGPFDIIVDDGSHVNEHIITTFKILFPLLKSPGIYAIEDLQTSYWSGDFGGSEDLRAEFTAMGFLKGLTDGLNFQEFKTKRYAPSYFDRNIVSIHFYHNLVFIYKGTNNEGSNMVRPDETDAKGTNAN